jgi:hypothetical protein
MDRGKCAGKRDFQREILPQGIIFCDSRFLPGVVARLRKLVRS